MRSLSVSTSEHTEQNLEKLLLSTHAFSRDIGMQFGLDKCLKMTLKAGKKVQLENITLGQEDVIKNL